MDENPTHRPQPTRTFSRTVFDIGLALKAARIGGLDRLFAVGTNMHTLHRFAPLIGALLACAGSIAALEDRTENENAAIAALRTIQTAQIQYYSQFGRYASSLRQLGERDKSGKSTPEAAGLLDAELASGVKNGYRFTLERVGPAAYATKAAPTAFGNTGSRTYCSDQTGVIHEHQGPEPATVRDPEVHQ
jgi:hypothetical protein